MKFSCVCAATILILSITAYGNATEEFAEKTEKSCESCHLDSSGGGELTKTGKDFLQSLAEETQDKEVRISEQKRRGVSHYVRFLIGFLHIITAFFWFGTILYVHVILKPAYAVHGLPKAEVRLGLFSMLIMGITGTILTVHRIPSISLLYGTRFGILLLAKIVLYLIMVFSALYVVIFLGPKLRKTHQENHSTAEGDFTVDDLRHFNGKGDKASFVAYKGKIYDVTESESWKDGVHFGRHKAGVDLSEMLKQAPHSDDKILKMPLKGKLVQARIKKELVQHEKVFYFMAHLNLIIVVLIILILALWKWW
jgi:predicted heme/steroid binding protein